MKVDTWMITAIEDALDEYGFVGSGAEPSLEWESIRLVNGHPLFDSVQVLRDIMPIDIAKKWKMLIFASMMKNFDVDFWERLQSDFRQMFNEWKESL